MTQFFIGLYDYFERHKILFYLSLISCVLLMGFFALQVRFEENITQFFPDTKDSQNTIKVFDNLKIKDKIIIMLSSADTCHRVEPNSLIEAAGQLQQTLTEKAGGKLIKGILAQVDQSLIQGATDFVYEHLPLFLTDTDYQRFDSLLTDKGIQAVMQKNYTNLLSPAGIALRSICKISNWKPTTRFMTNISSPKTAPPYLCSLPRYSVQAAPERTTN